MSLADINRNLDRWYHEKRAGVDAVGKNIAAKAEAKSKQKDMAIWKDQTGHARQSLKGQSGWENRDIFKIILSHTVVDHGVEYGIYLELAHDRKYAVLEKTLNSLRGETYRNIKLIMSA